MNSYDEKEQTMPPSLSQHHTPPTRPLTATHSALANTAVLDAPQLSAQYMQRRMMRQQQLANGSVPPTPQLQYQQPPMHQQQQQYSHDLNYTQQQQAPPQTAPPSSAYHDPSLLLNNNPYPDVQSSDLTSLHHTLSTFHSQLRRDFDTTFTTLERKQRVQRKELLSHVTLSLEEIETRLLSTLKSNLNEYQLLEVEFRKNLKRELYALKSDYETSKRKDDDTQAELVRKMKIQEMSQVEMKTKLDDVLVGGGGGLLAGSSSLSGAAGALHADQQLLSLQSSLDTLSSRTQYDLLEIRKESELKHIELSHQILDLRKIVDSLVTSQESVESSFIDLIHKQGVTLEQSLHQQLDSHMSSYQVSLQNLYTSYDALSQAQESVEKDAVIQRRMHEEKEEGEKRKVERMEKQMEQMQEMMRQMQIQMQTQAQQLQQQQQQQQNHFISPSPPAQQHQQQPQPAPHISSPPPQKEPVASKSRSSIISSHTIARTPPAPQQKAPVEDDDDDDEFD